METKKIFAGRTNDMDEYPIEVRKIVNAVCFFMKAVNVFIYDLDEKNDREEAIKAFEKEEQNNPGMPLILIGKSSCSEFIDKKSFSIDHFPNSCRSREFAIQALTFLKDRNLVPNSTKESTWLYIIGISTEKPDNMEKIKWFGTKENLRQFLTLWFEDEIKNKIVKVKELQNLTPFCFVDKNNKMAHFAKKRHENSPIPDLIENFFRAK